LLHRCIKEELHRGEKHTKKPHLRIFQDVKVDMNKYLTKNEVLNESGYSVGLTVSCSV